jgi:hypothetical protein
MIAGAGQLLLLRDGGPLREGVARRSRTAGGTSAGRDRLTPLIYLRDQQTEPQSVPSLGLIQPRRSIKGSETPHHTLEIGRIRSCAPTQMRLDPDERLRRWRARRVLRAG